jgi:hypothetical protein
MAVAPIDVESLRQQVAYDPETGAITRLVARSINPKSVPGLRLGTPCRGGYLMVRVGKSRYLAHRLAWFHAHGRWPDGDIDHVNGNKADNRLCNLREATRSQNMANTSLQANNTSGVRGVCFAKHAKKWLASLTVSGKQKHLGLFASKEEAAVVRERAFRSAFGEFAGRQQPSTL